MLSLVGFGVLAYLIGSIPFGYLIAWRRGVDIRTVGSGNIGATNVARALGRKTGVFVFFLDALKGAIPTALGQECFGVDGGMIGAGMALLGHMFPIWLKFRGGKGVATGAGALAVLLPVPVILGLIVWLAAFSTWRIVSLASLTGAATLAGVAVSLALVSEHRDLDKKAIVAVAAFLVVAVRHATNMVRIARGTENQFSESAALRATAKVIHVLSLSLWFGSNFFFSLIAAVLIFRTWEGYAEDPPTWLPGFSAFTKETGTRIAGATVGPIFPFLFALQGFCSLLALMTSLGFTRWEPHRRLHRIRFAIVVLAALTVVAGWPISRYVSTLREQRDSRDPSISALAKERFGPWHAVSLFLNFGTIGLTGVATSLAAFLPPQRPSPDSGNAGSC
ncbi:MAG: glycerol-3-phosphate 1-O-acyltransferase PlsY [Gemmataceae bacterium]|nr:glycerol-3-phosphate 1-O-acyltransferase PlsY [Gemmataceae bacterium]